ncbi:sulfotransferase [Alcanivorax jadensis T9]|mgnify:CR=1 FL=1|uniref:Sulfotransferase n=2 Tax=Alcanivoracaceae TaxID=224372 RepID=A0ABR4WCZ0_9GAMM|nr:sulfotransferase [Alcanivorax jadensis T9]
MSLTLKNVLKKMIRRLLEFFFGGGRPDFIIVGAQKSGTSSLFNYLNKSPEMIGSTIKELHYFDREDNFKKGDVWYESHFLRMPGKKGLFFEASPSYLARECVPQRIASYKSDIKIIVLLREPISRAYSAWNMYRYLSEEGKIPASTRKDHIGRSESPVYSVFFKNGCPSFSDYIDYELDLIKQGDGDEEPSVLRRGIYKPQLERYARIFGRENMLVIGFNELKVDSEAVVKKCHDFLGVPYTSLGSGQTRKIQNKKPYTSSINDRDIQILEDFYARPNSELKEWLGYDIDW